MHTAHRARKTASQKSVPLKHLLQLWQLLSDFNNFFGTSDIKYLRLILE